jgi:purine-binding chemotaxis protein CheW
MSDDLLQVACFRVGDAHYAVDVMAVVEIVNPTPVAPLPGSAALVEGLVELRGGFLPLVDLRRRFGAPVGPPGRYVIASVRGSHVALAVDEVSDIDRIPREQFVAPPAMGADALAPPYLAGVATWKDRVLYLVALDGLFAADELRALAVAASA